MRKIIPIALLALAGCACALAQQAGQAAQPSLGDVARKQRAQDDNAPKTKVWTNDDFGDSPAPAPETKSDADATQPADADKAKSPDAKKDAAATVEDHDKLNKEWKDKIDAQKKKIADLQHDYDLTDREYKIFMTSYYADAGNRLRDQKDFHDKEQEYRDKLGTLKDQLATEQTNLSDLQDQAHKAGADKAYD